MRPEKRQGRAGGRFWKSEGFPSKRRRGHPGKLGESAARPPHSHLRFRELTLLAARKVTDWTQSGPGPGERSRQSRGRYAQAGAGASGRRRKPSSQRECTRRREDDPTFWPEQPSSLRSHFLGTESRSGNGRGGGSHVPCLRKSSLGRHSRGDVQKPAGRTELELT